jgi:nuclear migration protein JNM1
LYALQSELAALEAELADPSNPQLHKERQEDNVDPGELIRGLVDVRGRLEKIKMGKEGRGRLIEFITGRTDEFVERDGGVNGEKSEGDKGTQKEGKNAVRSIVEMDRRVGELEKLVGSSDITLDEVYHILNFSTYFHLLHWLVRPPHSRRLSYH